MSVKTDESAVVVEDVSLSHGEFVIHAAGAGELVVPHKSLDVSVEKMETSEEEERAANPEQVRIEPFVAR